MPQWRGQNWTLQGGPLLISRGSTFWPLFKYVSFARGSKTGPSTGWIWCLLGGPVLSPPQAPSSAALFQCRSASASHKNTALAIRASNSSGPNSVSKSFSFSRSCCLVKSDFSTFWMLINGPVQQNRGACRQGLKGPRKTWTRTKRGSRGLETFDFKSQGELSGNPSQAWNTFPLHGGPKLDPQQVESGASLEVRF